MTNTRDQLVELIKSDLKGRLVKYLVGLLVSKIPFLGGAFFNPIVTFIIGKGVEAALESGEMGIFFLYTDFRVSRQGRAYLDNLIALRDAQGSGDEQRIRDAEIKTQDSFRNLVKLNN